MRAWLFSILHNHWGSQARRRARRLPALSQALARLPDTQRDVLLPVAVEELSYAETAGVLTLPIGTVRSRVSRGRETLRRVFGGTGDDYDDHSATTEADRR